MSQSLWGQVHDRAVQVFGCKWVLPHNHFGDSRLNHLDDWLDVRVASGQPKALHPLVGAKSHQQFVGGRDDEVAHPMGTLLIRPGQHKNLDFLNTWLQLLQGQG